MPDKGPTVLAPENNSNRKEESAGILTYRPEGELQQRVLSPALTAFPLGRTATSGPPSPTKLRKTFVHRMNGLFIFSENFFKNHSVKVFLFG